MVKGTRCATIDNAPPEIRRAPPDKWTSLRSQTETVNIPVVFHVIYKVTNGKAKGNVPDSQIEAQMEVLNTAYAGSGFSFTLQHINRVKKDNWFNLKIGTAEERRMKEALAVNPTHTLNIYSCDPKGILGYAYMPWAFPEDSFMHGVVLYYASLPGGSAVPYG